jgi:hypothetical protein
MSRVRNIYEFVTDYTDMIDENIRQFVPPDFEIDDEERVMWVLNDEALYMFAIEMGYDV